MSWRSARNEFPHFGNWSQATASQVVWNCGKTSMAFPLYGFTIELSRLLDFSREEERKVLFREMGRPRPGFPLKKASASIHRRRWGLSLPQRRIHIPFNKSTRADFLSSGSMSVPPIPHYHLYMPQLHASHPWTEKLTRIPSWIYWFFSKESPQLLNSHQLELAPPLTSDSTSV